MSDTCDKPLRFRRVLRLPGRALCLVRVHRWYYFIDGSVCRACTKCPRVQYDLSAVRR